MVARIATPGKGEDLLDQFARPLTRPADLVENAGGLMAFIRHFDIAQDGAEDVVEVMCDPAGERTYGLHTPSLLQPQFQARAFLFEGLSAEGIGDDVQC